MLKKIESDDKTKYDTSYSHSKAETVIHESDISDVFESIYSTVISNIQEVLGKGSSWIIEYITIIINYIKLRNKLDHSRNGLINIQNIYDNEYFRKFLVRYLHPADPKLARITKVGKDFSKRLDFKDVKISIQN